MSAGHLPPRHLLLALAVVAVWGTNFVVIKAALDTLPPLLLATLRFGLAMLVAGERLRGHQGLALALAAVGLALIAAHTDAATTPLGLGVWAAEGKSLTTR